MAVYIATIQVFVEVDSEAEACDGIAETMREHLQRYAPESCILDWQHLMGSPALASEAEEAQIRAQMDD